MNQYELGNAASKIDGYLLRTRMPLASLGVEFARAQAECVSAVQLQLGNIQSLTFEQFCAATKRSKLASVHAAVEVTQEQFLKLQEEAESLELAHAKGQDLPEHAQRLGVINTLMNSSQWTLDPDHGCELKADVRALSCDATAQIG